MLELQALKNKFDIIGNSPVLNYALATAEKVAPTDLTVLILGESVVGKEVFSKIIHQLSPRKHGPFIAINCGAIPEGTIDSELFGHEKGSFTGATDTRKGYFETVNGGTIFLDEIAEMPLGTQARLLRLLQNGEYIKVGASQVLKTDVRVIAATNVNLLDAVQRGKFREDLYYRLNTVPIIVPPLRERGHDIALLFRKFSVDFCEKNKIQPPNLTEEARDLILKYRWPGNIRQLKSVAEQVSILTDSDTLYPEDIARFIPNHNTSLNIGVNSTNDFGQIGNEITLKMLVDIKQDINEMKRMFFELTKNTPTNFEEFTGDQDTRIVGAERYLPQVRTGGSYTPNVIELPERNSSMTKPINGDYVPENLNLIDMEKRFIISALKKHKGKRKYAAEELGISERTLYRKIIDYDIEE
jgi:transcriptional regulator with PAS, ATPase and Fis domain